MKEKGAAEARCYDDVSVLFTDFVDFTRHSEKLKFIWRKWDKDDEIKSIECEEGQVLKTIDEAIAHITMTYPSQFSGLVP
ncbi:MAG: hypothetical protein EOP04_09330 [Proteobacteria bacterium]|nr:MAG: hypothetical protein EOP04_09330 [Pseudomonadota bacterium]